MARYSGSLVASTRGSYAPGDNAKNWGEGVDARHGTAGPDLGFPPPAPHVKLEVPDFIEDQVTLGREPPYFPDADMETAQYDDIHQHEPQPGGLPYGVPDNDRLRTLSGALHSRLRRIPPYRMATMVARDFTTENESRREQSLPAVRQEGSIAGQSLRALRGFNSLAVNNPGDPEISYSGNYVRQGWDLSRITNRRMPRRGLTHTKRVLHVNTADTAIDTAPHPGPYSSSFRNFGRLNVGAYLPSIRREPRPWDEDQANDYSADEQANYNSWGL